MAGLPAHHRVRDAAGNEVVDLVLGDLLLLERSTRGEGSESGNGGELHFVGDVV